MYPRGELAELAIRREYLQARIALRREETIAAFRQLARPIGWIDGAIGHWRRVGPAVKVLGVPAVLLLARKVARRFRWKGLLAFARAVPAVMQVARSYAPNRR